MPVESEAAATAKAPAIPSARAREGGGFRADIEGLRGIAVLLVLLYHAGLLSDSRYQVRGGFLGVDLFFVVSGYLITGLLLAERRKKGTVSFASFYARRVRRILPAAAMVLIVTLPLSFALVTLIQKPAVMKDGATAALSIANIRFALTTDYFNPTSYSPFLHFWSLGVEEQFYFVWPAVLALAAWRWWRVGPAVALGFIAVASFVASLIVTNENPSWAFYMLPTRAWQLASGGLLAIAATSGLAMPERAHFLQPERLRSLLRAGLSLLGWIALAVLLWDAFTLDFARTPYPGIAALRPTLCAAALIATGTQRLGAALLLGLTPLRFVGRISYSLYLWHWPLLILGGLALNGQVWQPLSVRQAAFLAALAIPVAAISWRFVEEPFRKGKLSFALPPVRVVAVGVSAMLVLALLGSSLDTNARSALAALDAGTPNASGQVLPTGSAAPNYAVTSALRPGLGRAATDFERTVGDGCLIDWGVKSPGDGCVYGDPNGTYEMALVGDSHASALFPAVESVARSHGWRLQVYLKRGCPFIDMRLYAANLKREYTECQSWNERVVERLRSRPPDLMLVSQLRFVVPVDPADNTDTAKGDAIAREIARIPGTTRTVILEDPPLPGHSVPDCLSAHLDDYRKCAFSRSASSAGVGAKERIAAATSGAALVDLSPEVCPGVGNCPVVIDGMIVWRDDTHLTATFAASLGPALDRQLATILAYSR